MTNASVQNSAGYLSGIRVIELGDEQGEYAGKLLAGLGAEVIKVEPPEGNSTRGIGPFLDDTPHPDRSLHFWHYNFGKTGLALDLGDEGGKARFLDLVNSADILLESTPHGYLPGLGITYEGLKATNPALVWSRISPFGDDGPWAAYAGSDLVHLALGGMMMNTGYDPDPVTGKHDLPPIAPQMFHSYHVAGQHAVIATIGALMYRHGTGHGQYVSTAVHEANAKNTEIDIPAWIYQRRPLFRQTCRHANSFLTPSNICQTKDGRYFMIRTGLLPKLFFSLVEMLDKYGHAEDLLDAKYEDAEYRARPEVTQHINATVQRFFSQSLFEGPWHEAQERGQVCAPLRKPEENLADEHWRARNIFRDVEHPELGKQFTYVWAPWMDHEVPWRTGPRAPLLDEARSASVAPHQPGRQGSTSRVGQSARGKPFALNNVRVLDFTWWLASGGGPRFLAALGAEVIKVEWRGRWDLRFMNTMPEGGRSQRDAATEPCVPSPPPSASNGLVNRSGTFNDINPGKRGISLNMNNPKAGAVLRRLIEVCDVVVEGFSPEVMRKWGFPYETLREINPSIIYVQQSGMGQGGTYGKYRATGPVAASLSGLSEMSGFPVPFQPAGIGYSFLDWFGAYNIATAMMAALYRRETTGKGTYIDASQVEAGISLVGSSVLNYSANGTPWQRYGNRSPWKAAAPCGAYRCEGDDRWIAVTCFTQQQWESTVRVLGKPVWADDPAFATLEARLANQDQLDGLMNAATSTWDRYQLMDALQTAGVPAGVCQDAQDRCERDPQLRHLEWLTEVRQTEMGTWPLKEFPVKLSETPTYMGGPMDRGAPCYGEDDAMVYGEMLGMSAGEIEALRAEDVI